MNSSHSTNSPAVNNNSPITESQKTKLISRIAKLGQPILPLKGAAVAEESGSEQVNQNCLIFSNSKFSLLLSSLVAVLSRAS